MLSTMIYPSFVPFSKTKPAWKVPKGVGNQEKKKRELPSTALPTSFFAPTKQAMQIPKKKHKSSAKEGVTEQFGW